MGFFANQFSSVIVWDEFREDMLFWKWSKDEIKKGSRLIIKPGQDAIFLFNGKLEGVFQDEGDYDIESEIIPFLSTLKGFRFGFKTGMRAEVLFINTKELLLKWGTPNAISIPAPNLPGGIPIRANGTCSIKIKDYQTLIDKVAGVKSMYTLDDIRGRIIPSLDQLLMKWITKEGKDMFNLQKNAFDIGNGIKNDLDMLLFDIGISVTTFNVSSFSYPPEIQKMQEKAASHAMIGDMNKYTQVAMADSLTQPNGNNMAAAGAQMAMGLQFGQQMVQQMQQPGQNNNPSQSMPNNGTKTKFCSNCGTPAGEGNFCSNCGNKLSI